MTDARHALYRGVTRLFDASGRGGEMDGLSAKQRQLLLLTSLEDVSEADSAPILGVTQDVAARYLAEARERLRASAATDVLIIEDEPIIAMDLEELVQSCGHRVVGVAASESEAIAMAKQTKPGLILADINLGLGGDGTNARERHPGQPLRASDLRDGLSGAAADRRCHRAGVRHYQAVRASDVGDCHVSGGDGWRADG